MKKVMNMTDGDSPLGNGDRVKLFTAAAYDATVMQQVSAAAIIQKQLLHSPKGNLLLNINPCTCKRS